MAEFTLPAAERRKLLAAAATDEEKLAIAEMIRAANDIDQQLAIETWRKNTLKFIAPLSRMDAEMAKLADNAGLLRSPEIRALRRRLAALRAELGLGAADAEADLEDDAAEADDLAAAASGPMPVTATANGAFETFFAATLPNVTFISASEFLYKGAKHAENGLNADPPKALWPNVAPLARLLNQLRSEIGAPVRLTSVYRSPAYNAAVDGAAHSQHMRFTAADFVAGAGGPADWAARLRRLRAAGAFSGGIGVYDRFVHVDVRGADVDW